MNTSKPAYVQQLQGIFSLVQTSLEKIINSSFPENLHPTPEEVISKGKALQKDIKVFISKINSTSENNEKQAADLRNRYYDFQTDYLYLFSSN